jgi:hypothetical protein
MMSSKSKHTSGKARWHMLSAHTAPDGARQVVQE